MVPGSLTGPLSPGCLRPKDGSTHGPVHRVSSSKSETPAVVVLRREACPPAGIAECLVAQGGSPRPLIWAEHQRNLGSQGPEGPWDRSI